MSETEQKESTPTKPETGKSIEADLEQTTTQTVNEVIEEAATAAASEALAQAVKNSATQSEVITHDTEIGSNVDHKECDDLHDSANPTEVSDSVIVTREDEVVDAALVVKQEDNQAGKVTAGKAIESGVGDTQATADSVVENAQATAAALAGDETGSCVVKNFDAEQPPTSAITNTNNISGQAPPPASFHSETTVPEASQITIVATAGETTSPLHTNAEAGAAVAATGADSTDATAIAAAAAAYAASAALSQTPTDPATDMATAAAAAAATDAAVAAAASAGLQPSDRDVTLGVLSKSESLKTNLLLDDLIRLHRILYRLEGKENPTEESHLSLIASRILELLKNGKPYELAGLKDVPKPFMKSRGRFMSKPSDGPTWKVLSDDEAKAILSQTMLEEFKKDDLGNTESLPFKSLKDLLLKAKKDETEEAPLMPDAKDPILLKVSETPGEKLYEQHPANKAMFNLASQLVTSYTSSSEKRVEAALTIVKRLEELELSPNPSSPSTVNISPKTSVPQPEKTKNGPSIATNSVSKSPKFLLRTQKPDGSVTWQMLNPAEAAEVCVVFVFEVFLEKEIHISAGTESSSLVAGSSVHELDQSNPSSVPIKEPTDHDVLFGRGGMTNSHIGNRRFRDIIALHRPDYIRAIKMDKPAVARKIVKAIRHGNPPGRFLKKHDDGFWYDVGDRTAAEKTSQGLRERSNAEKRQRSALREALRIRKQDMVDDRETPSKKLKLGDPTGMPDISTAVTPTLNYVGTSIGVPLSLNMKEQTKVSAKKKADAKEDKGVTSELKTEGLPPNAVDEDGNILVTDYDILCGRGGLTNHHKGNKRFRDIVALHRSDYVRAPKIQKPSVARVIVRAIRNGDPPGRFLKKDEKTGKWIDVGDKKAAEKTSQALREKTNEDREKLKRDPNAMGAGVLLPSPTTYMAAFGNSPMMINVPTTLPQKDGDPKPVSVPTPIVGDQNLVPVPTPVAESVAPGALGAGVNPAGDTVGAPMTVPTPIAAVTSTQASNAAAAPVPAESTTAAIAQQAALGESMITTDVITAEAAGSEEEQAAETEASEQAKALAAEAVAQATAAAVAAASQPLETEAAADSSKSFATESPVIESSLTADVVRKQPGETAGSTPAVEMSAAGDEKKEEVDEMGVEV